MQSFELAWKDIMLLLKQTLNYKWKKKYIKSSKLHKAGEDERNNAINARGRLEED